MNQIDGYSQYVNWTNFKLDSKYRYYNFPGESELVNGKIYFIISKYKSWYLGD